MVHELFRTLCERDEGVEFLMRAEGNIVSALITL